MTCSTWHEHRNQGHSFFLVTVTKLNNEHRMKLPIGIPMLDQSKKSPTGPTERTPKPEYLIALAPYLGVRW